jgi:hypothetical protein
LNALSTVDFTSLNQAIFRYQILSALNNETPGAVSGLSNALSQASISLDQSNTQYNDVLFNSSLNDPVQLIADLQQVWTGAVNGNLTSFPFALSNSSSFSSTLTSTNTGGNTSNTVSHSTSQNETH